MSSHLANVLFSIVLSQKMKQLSINNQQSQFNPDECNYYLVTIVLDCTLGVYISITILLSLEK